MQFFWNDSLFNCDTSPILCSESGSLKFLPMAMSLYQDIVWRSFSANTLVLNLAVTWISSQSSPESRLPELFGSGRARNRGRGRQLLVLRVSRRYTCLSSWDALCFQVSGCVTGHSFSVVFFFFFSPVFPSLLTPYSDKLQTYFSRSDLFSKLMPRS